MRAELTPGILKCSVHVASVLQMTHMLLTHGGIRQSNAMNMLEAYCTYWAAITHDFEHGGFNNDFLVNLTALYYTHCAHHNMGILLSGTHSLNIRQSHSDAQNRSAWKAKTVIART